MSNRNLLLAHSQTFQLNPVDSCQPARHAATRQTPVCVSGEHVALIATASLTRSAMMVSHALWTFAQRLISALTIRCLRAGHVRSIPVSARARLRAGTVRRSDPADAEAVRIATHALRVKLAAHSVCAFPDQRVTTIQIPKPPSRPPPELKPSRLDPPPPPPAP